MLGVLGNSPPPPPSQNLQKWEHGQLTQKYQQIFVQISNINTLLKAFVFLKLSWFILIQFIFESMRKVYLWNSRFLHNNRLKRNKVDKKLENH